MKISNNTDNSFGNASNNTFSAHNVEFYGVLFRDLVFVAYIATFFFGVFGNVVVCYVLFSRKQKRKSIHLLTMNLAISDLIVSTIYLPMQMYLIKTQLKWGLGDIMCRVFNGINSLTVNASIGTLVVITYDRYNAVVKPMVVHSRNTSTTKILIAVVWVTSFALTIPLILVAKVRHGYCSESWPGEKYEQGYWTSAFVLQFALPLIYISVTYVIIICAVKTSQSQFELVHMQEEATKVPQQQTDRKSWRRKNQNLNVKDDSNNNSMRSNRYTVPPSNNHTDKRRGFRQQSRSRLKRKKQQNKLLKMSILLVITYCVCALPQHAVYFAMTYSDFYMRSYSVMMFVLANFLMAVNSALNPVIYGTLNDEMKKGFKRMMSINNKRLTRNASDAFTGFRETVRRRLMRTNTENSI